MRSAVLLISLAVAGGAGVMAQSVVSTHSGVVYYFTGSVFLADQPLEQKFGRFPQIGDGGVLRTALGRAEVLLTPGVFLRLDQDSSIRMISSSFADTRVELLGGSAILEVTEAVPGNTDRLIYKNWQVRVPQKGVCRIDTQPPQIRAYQGEVEVAAEGSKDGVTAKEGEVLPLAAVLVPEPSTASGNDDFKYWATIRSEAIAQDNTVAAGIVADPTQADSSGMASGGYTYFPQTAIPSLDIGSPYGLSFWSPLQPALTSMYFSTVVYAPVFVGWPAPRRPISGPLGFQPRPLPISTRPMPYPRHVPVPRGPTILSHPAAHASAVHVAAPAGHR